MVAAAAAGSRSARALQRSAACCGHCPTAARLIAAIVAARRDLLQPLLQRGAAYCDHYRGAARLIAAVTAGQIRSAPADIAEVLAGPPPPCPPPPPDPFEVRLRLRARAERENERASERERERESESVGEREKTVRERKESDKREPERHARACPPAPPKFFPPLPLPLSLFPLIFSSYLACALFASRRTRAFLPTAFAQRVGELLRS